ncbi:hypothetical protein [Methylopila sp. M107]|uniref:hypothetical protein n=1 Tax=Methylopila sp. M107 TaxID=1101190 RepID=UPI000374BF7F|nr:hypothetical protein [Methylopila sp. M107]
MIPGRRRFAPRSLAALLAVLALAGAARAQPSVSCERVSSEVVGKVLTEAAALLNADGPTSEAEAAAVLGTNVALEPDIYEPGYDQFGSKVYRGLAGWNEFKATVGATTFRDFRFESAFPFLGCKAALVVGHFHVVASDEYRPWFYEAALFRGEGGLRLGYLRLPTPAPRKSFGSPDACDGSEGPAEKYESLRGDFVAAVKSGREDRLAGLFSPTDILSHFDPVFGGKTYHGIEKMLVVRAAAARYFADRTVEDLPEERRAVLICKNLNYGGVLKVTDKNGFVRYVGYRAYAPLFHKREDKRTSMIDLGLTIEEIVHNLPETVDDWLKPALEEIRASEKR